MWLDIFLILILFKFKNIPTFLEFEISKDI